MPSPVSRGGGEREVSRTRMKYFHFHDWTGEELAAAARIPPRQMEIRDSACVGHERGGGGGHEGKRKARSSGRAVGQRERETISPFFPPAVSLSLSLSLWQSQDGRSPRVRDAPRVN